LTRLTKKERLLSTTLIARKDIEKGGVKLMTKVYDTRHLREEAGMESGWGARSVSCNRLIGGAQEGDEKRRGC